jgi:hypothetical protein
MAINMHHQGIKGIKEPGYVQDVELNRKVETWA